MADDKEVEKTIAEDLVVTKYKLAGQIVNRKFYNNTVVALYKIFFRTEGRANTCTFMSIGRVSSPCGQCDAVHHGLTFAVLYWTNTLVIFHYLFQVF